MQTKRWSNEALQTEFGGCNVLRDVITELESKFLVSGEVICEIRVNGMFLTEEDEAKFANSHLSEITELEISSRRPQDLISESLQSTLEWVPKVRDYALETSDQLREVGIDKSQVSFAEVLDGCRWLTDALSLLKSVIITLSENDRFEERWLAAENGLSEVVCEIVEAYDAGDCSRLADTIEYDLSTCLDAWNDLLNSEPKIIARSVA